MQFENNSGDGTIDNTFNLKKPYLSVNYFVTAIPYKNSKKDPIYTSNDTYIVSNSQFVTTHYIYADTPHVIKFNWYACGY